MTAPIGLDRTRAFWRSPFFIILAAYVCLGILYAAATPIFENGDEEYHFQYALGLARGSGLPVVGASPLDQVAAHPPLYYAIGSLFLRWVETDDLAAYFRFNPHAQLTRFDQPYNKNRFIHTDREAFPYHGTALAVQLLRYLSLAFGLLTVTFTGLMARKLFPQRESAVWVAMSAVAFLPQFLVISTAARNDAAIIALSAIGLWGMVVGLQRPLTGWQLVGLGIVCGLAALAKTSGLLLTTFVVGVLALSQWVNGGFKSAIRIGGLIGLPTGLMAGWWYVRNFMLYQDFTGAQAMFSITGQRGFSLWQVLTSSEPFLWSWWGTAGWFNIAMPTPIYWVLDVLALVLLVGAGGLAWRAWQKGSRLQAFILAVLMAWSLVAYIGVVTWAQRAPLGYDGRLAFPGLPTFAVLCAAGWAYWASVRWERVLGALALAGWGGLAAAFPILIVIPAFARPPIIAQGNVPATLLNAPQTYAGEVQLLGASLLPQPAKPGEPINVTLYWKALTKPTRPYSVILSVLGRDDQVLAHSDSYPGGGNYPTDLWEPGEVIADTYRLSLAPNAVLPTRMQIFLGLYVFDSDAPVDPPPAALPLNGNIVALPAQPEGLGAQPGLASFENKIVLTGATVTPATVAPGGSLAITLNWATREAFSEDFTVFTHLIDSQGQLAGQLDRQPANGYWPTTLWVPTMLWTDTYSLPVAATAQAGPAHLEIGFYRLSDGSRLALDAGGDTYQLSTPVVIQP